MKRHKHLRFKTLIAITALAAVTVMPAGRAGAGTNDLSKAEAAGAGYRNINNALAAGYSLLTDASGIACIDNPGVGAMGIHYANTALVGDPGEHAATPEAVVYEPEPDGHLRMVAVEYVVLKAAWEAAGNTAPPTLFGQTFMLITSPNRFGLPDYYALHAWIGKHNPSGMFSMWNPAVSCTATPTTGHGPQRNRRDDQCQGFAKSNAPDADRLGAIKSLRLRFARAR